MAKHIFFEITDKCNEKCSHCDKSWRQDGGHTMDTEMLDKILAIPKEFLVISGGEPGVAPNKVRYVVEHCQTPLSINTNLTLWSEEMMNLFIQHKVTLAVSVVSLNRETYKKITGADLVDKLRHNIDLISRNSRITIIVNDENIDEVESMVNYLVVRGFCNFIIQPAIPGMGAPFNYGAYQKRLKAVKSAYRHHRNVNIALMSYYDGSCEALPVDHVCEAGEDRLVILSNGDVVPCACMTPHVLGNIISTPWETLELRGLEYFHSFKGADQYTCKGFLENQGAKKGRRPATILNHPETIYSLLPLNACGIWYVTRDNAKELPPNIRYDCILADEAFYFVDDIDEFVRRVNRFLARKPRRFICIQRKLGVRQFPMPTGLEFDGYLTHDFEDGFWLERI